ncbi:oxygenase MpaB family protein [Actinomadura madurae]|uniref:oxygenase MpaB family protein n=1 Tax=Actinomadura madurae TaxID=1993 RepID=UPI0027E24C9A|nr:oxygenase MpaB family protein [Actinomadura madurae]
MSTAIPKEARAVYYSQGGADMKDRITKTAKLGYDVGTENAFDPDGEMIVTCVKTRLVHAAVRHLLPKSPYWSKVADEEIPISQADMMVTWHSLPTTVMQNLVKWKVPIPAAESAAFLHSWQVTAHMLGILDEYIPASWDEADSQAEQVLDPILAPHPRGHQAGRHPAQPRLRHRRRPAHQADPRRPHPLHARRRDRRLAEDPQGAALGQPPEDPLAAVHRRPRRPARPHRRAEGPARPLLDVRRDPPPGGPDLPLRGRLPDQHRDPPDQQPALLTVPPSGSEPLESRARSVPGLIRRRGCAVRAGRRPATGRSGGRCAAGFRRFGTRPWRASGGSRRSPGRCRPGPSRCRRPRWRR